MAINRAFLKACHAVGIHIACHGWQATHKRIQYGCHRGRCSDAVGAYPTSRPPSYDKTILPHQALCVFSPKVFPSARLVCDTIRALMPHKKRPDLSPPPFLRTNKASLRTLSSS
jgi:hypothetical protein